MRAPASGSAYTGASGMSEPNGDKRRKYPRFKAPKGTFVGWKAPGHHTASPVGELGMGGLFLYVAKPPSTGSTLELVFDLPTGEIRGRAIVRHSKLGVGMGVQFIQMRPEERARLNRFLASQEEARHGAAHQQPSAAPRPSRPAAKEPPASAPAAEVAPGLLFEEELKHLLELAQKATHYQLLSVTPQSTTAQVKKSFYSLARKFHPDHHMQRPELAGSLQQLMEAITDAYKTLTDDARRAQYDKSLAASGAFNLGRGKTESQEILEESLARANECIRARNFVGSIQWLRKCAAVAPENAKIHAMLARSLRHIGRHNDEAVEHYEKAVELDPLNAAVFFQFGEFCEEMGIPSRARELYGKVLEIDPTHAKTLGRLAQLDAAERTESSVFSRMFSRKS
jgi:tetratricopeptide (TPR) repeat protein